MLRTGPSLFREQFFAEPSEVSGNGFCAAENSTCCDNSAADSPGFNRVETVKALGVTISRRFSVKQHVDDLLVACAQTQFVLRTLCYHGLPIVALQAVFQATVVARMSYASPAWWGYTSAADRSRLEAFLRRSIRFGYRADSSTAFTRICADAPTNNMSLSSSVVPTQCKYGALQVCVSSPRCACVLYCIVLLMTGCSRISCLTPAIFSTHSSHLPVHSTMTSGKDLSLQIPS